MVDAGTPPVLPPIAIEEPNARAFVSGIIDVNLNSGERLPFVDLPGVNRFVIDIQRGRLIATEPDRGAVVAIDIASKAITTLTSTHFPNDVDPLVGPSRRLAIDVAGNRALIPDVSPQQGVVIAVDLATGRRTRMTDNAQPNTGDPLISADGIAVDAERDRALLADPSAQRVWAIDLRTGVRTVFSDNAVPDGDTPFSNPIDIDVDAEGNRAFVLDFAGFLGSSVISVDLDTGRRHVLSDATTPDAVEPLMFPSQVTLDRARNRLLVVTADGGKRSIVGVDLTTGHRTVLLSRGGVEASGLGAIAVDADTNRLLVTDFGSLLWIDPTTGAQSTLSDYSQRNPQYGFFPVDLAIELMTGRVFVLDRNRGLLAVNPTTGERVFLSR